MSEQPRRRVAVVGATGVAGQQFLVSLANHPWFELCALAASERSAGRTYRDAITGPGGALRWACDEPLPERFAAMPVIDARALDPRSVDLVFSAVESDAARVLEERFAPQVPVVSTSSAFRYEDDVPVIVPGVNHEHAALSAPAASAAGLRRADPELHDHRARRRARAGVDWGPSHVRPRCRRSRAPAAARACTRSTSSTT
jgi:aspartate-semialdehyde dehydrogenase